MIPHKSLDEQEFINSNFRRLLGKIYRPYKDKRIFYLALDNSNVFEEENLKLLDFLKESFLVEKCRLGENSETVLYRENMNIH